MSNVHRRPAAGCQPHTRAGARQRKSTLSLTRISLVAAALLLIAYGIGKRPSEIPNTVTRLLAAPVRSVATPSQPMVIPGDTSAAHGAIGEARMSASPDGRTLRIEGSVGRNFATDLQQLLERHPALQRIDITSGGGYVSSGLQAASLIRKRNLIVKVHSYCASICVALWAAGAQRQMAPDAVIGLHQWNPGCEALPSSDRAECRYRAQFLTAHVNSHEGWLRGAGFNTYLLDLQKNTAAENIALLNVLQLWDNGVEFSVSGSDGKSISRSAIERNLAQIPPRARRS